MAKDRYGDEIDRDAPVEPPERRPTGRRVHPSSDVSRPDRDDPGARSGDEALHAAAERIAPTGEPCRCVSGWVEELPGDDGIPTDRWYPCKVHNSERFWRWLRGHYSADHDPEVCEECTKIRRTKHGSAA